MKILDKEKLREGTVKFTIKVRKNGQLRVIVYPGVPMQVLSDDGAMWLQSDLSEKDQKKLLAEYKKMVS